LQVKAGGRYIDGTVGGGGHAEAILQASDPDGLLLGLDRDPAAVQRTRERLAPFGDRATIVHRSFTHIEQVARSHGFTHVDGVLLDLGFSSLQLDEAARGFSFQSEGPLDMRFDTTSAGPTAEMLVNQLPEEELANLLYRYGEEKQARRIASAIVENRPIHTTTGLAEVIEEAATGFQRIHPATRSFQALRIAVNDELGALEAALPQILDLLNSEGRMGVISFHSLEDRIVKNFMRRESKDCICSKELPVCVCGHKAQVRLITKKPVRPTEEEVANNPRSRSARLRVAERL